MNQSPEPVVTVHIKVYIAAGTAGATRTVQVVREMAALSIEGEVAIEVIDVLTSPELAERADVLATPTIDCVAPLPRRRVVGIPSGAADLARGLILDGAGRTDSTP